MPGRRRLLTWAVHLASLTPLALLVWDAWQGQLTANPVQAVELRTGKPALVLLILSLACTPAAYLTGWAAIRPLRRTLGLYAFLYASLHALTFVGLDYGFDLTLLPEALFEKRFALAGVAAFAALAPLALTSTRGWQRRLGPGWQRLHRLAYLAAAAGGPALPVADQGRHHPAGPVGGWPWGCCWPRGCRRFAPP